MIQAMNASKPRHSIALAILKKKMRQFTKLNKARPSPTPPSRKQKVLIQILGFVTKGRL